MVVGHEESTPNKKFAQTQINCESCGINVYRDQQRITEKENKIKISLLVLMTLFLLNGAWVGHAIHNDFVLYLFGLLSLAPTTAFLIARCTGNTDLRAH